MKTKRARLESELVRYLEMEAGGMTESEARDARSKAFVSLVGLCAEFNANGSFLMTDTALRERYERRIRELAESI